MSEKTNQFSGPAVGYGRSDSGEHIICLYSTNCFINTDTARELATDLLIWAQRIDERNKADGRDDE